MATPGVKAVHNPGFMAKAKRCFHIGFIYPRDIPVFRKMVMLWIMIAPDRHHGNDAAPPPVLYRVMDGSGERLWTMQEVAKHQNTGRARLISDGAQFI